MELYQVVYQNRLPDRTDTARTFFFHTEGSPYVCLGTMLIEDYGQKDVIFATLTSYNREAGKASLHPTSFDQLSEMSSWHTLERKDVPAALDEVEEELGLTDAAGRTRWLHQSVDESFLEQLTAWDSPKNSLVRARVESSLPGLQIKMWTWFTRWSFHLYGRVQQWSLNRAF